MWVLIEALDLELGQVILDTLKSKMEDENFKSTQLMEVMDARFESFYSTTRLDVWRPGESEVCTFDSPFGLSSDELLSEIVKSDREYLERKIEEIKTSSKKNRSDLELSLINKYSMKCYDDASDSKKPVIDRKIKDLISCEIKHSNNPYFKMVGKWHKSSEQFFKELNEEFGSVFSDCYWEFPFSVKWGEDGEEGFKENENTYLEYLAENLPRNTLLLHKVLPVSYKIELCDLIYWNDTDLFLIHVKPSFDGAVRILEKQIVHSAKIVSEDLRFELRSEIRKMWQA